VIIFAVSIWLNTYW